MGKNYNYKILGIIIIVVIIGITSTIMINNNNIKKNNTGGLAATQQKEPINSKDTEVKLEGQAAIDKGIELGFYEKGSTLEDIILVEGVIIEQLDKGGIKLIEPILEGTATQVCLCSGQGGQCGSASPYTGNCRQLTSCDGTCSSVIIYKNNVVNPLR